MSIRHIRRVLGGALLSMAALAHAGPYPERPVKLIVPFPPGGLVGNVAMALSKKMGEQLGQPVVVENRPGAAGTIAASAVAKAANDGYTILLGTSATHGIAKYIYADLPYDPIADFAPIGVIGDVTVGVFASPASGIDNVQALLAAARARPGEVDYGSPGVGSVSHLAAELFKSRAEIDVVHIPYAGTVPQMTDLVGGQTDIGFTGLGSGLTYVTDGRVKLLALAAAARSPNHPEVPALGELIEGYDAPAWLALFAPRGTAPEVLRKLEEALRTALTDSEIQTLLQTQGIDSKPMSASEFGAKMQREMPLWKEAVGAAGATGR